MALITLMRHWGIRADMCIGHSLGEVAAIYGAGGKWSFIHSLFSFRS